MKFMYMKHPGIAKRWSKENPGQKAKELPEHIAKQNHYKGKK